MYTKSTNTFVNSYIPIYYHTRIITAAKLNINSISVQVTIIHNSLRHWNDINVSAIPIYSAAARFVPKENIKNTVINSFAPLNCKFHLIRGEFWELAECASLAEHTGTNGTTLALRKTLRRSNSK